MAVDPTIPVLEAEIRRLRSALRDARDCIESWGGYASDYFKEKWDLAGDLAAIDAILGPEFACPICAKVASTLMGDCDHSDGYRDHSEAETTNND